MNRVEPQRGDVWTVNLDPTLGREQAGSRPALVFSTNAFNRGPADLIIVIPITSKPKGVPLHVAIDPPEGGVKVRSFVKTEDIRSISKARLGRRWGSVSRQILDEVADRVRILLEL